MRGMTYASVSRASWARVPRWPGHPYVVAHLAQPAVQLVRRAEEVTVSAAGQLILQPALEASPLALEHGEVGLSPRLGAAAQAWGQELADEAAPLATAALVVAQDAAVVQEDRLDAHGYGPSRWQTSFSETRSARGLIRSSNAPSLTSIVVIEPLLTANGFGRTIGSRSVSRT